MRSLGLDLDKDGRVDPQMCASDPAQAVEIFISTILKAAHSRACRSACRPACLICMSTRAQRGEDFATLLRDMGDCAVDVEVHWPAPLRAARASDAAPDHIEDAYGDCAAQLLLSSRRSSRLASRKYARTRAGGKGGWITRAEEFMSARYHLSDAQFQQRIASWA